MILCGDAKQLRQRLILHFGLGRPACPVHIPVLHLCILPLCPTVEQENDDPGLCETSLQISGLHYLVDKLYMDVRSFGPQSIDKILERWNPLVFSYTCVDLSLQPFVFPATTNLRLEMICIPAFGGGSYDPVYSVLAQCLAQNTCALMCVRITSHALLPDTYLSTYLYEDLVQTCAYYGIDLTFRCPKKRWNFDGTFGELLKSRETCSFCETDKHFANPFFFVRGLDLSLVSHLYTSKYVEKLVKNRPSTMAAIYWSRKVYSSLQKK